MEDYFDKCMFLLRESITHLKSWMEQRGASFGSKNEKNYAIISHVRYLEDE